MNNLLPFGLIILLISFPFIIKFVINLLFDSDKENINGIYNKSDSTYSMNVKNIRSAPTKNDELSNSKSNPTNYINHLRIISAGKNIKSIVYISASLFLLSLVFVLLILNSKSIESIKTYNIILSISILLFNILILIKLFNAGDDLENVVD